MKHVVRLTKYDETRGSLKFREDKTPGVPNVFGNLYVKKWAVPVGTQHVILTLEINEVNAVTVDLPETELIIPDAVDVSDHYPSQ